MKRIVLLIPVFPLRIKKQSASLSSVSFFRKLLKIFDIISGWTDGYLKLFQRMTGKGIKI